MPYVRLGYVMLGSVSRSRSRFSSRSGSNSSSRSISRSLFKFRFRYGMLEAEGFHRISSCHQSNSKLFKNQQLSWKVLIYSCGKDVSEYITINLFQQEKNVKKCPEMCSIISQPVCGSNGKTYG